MGAGSAAMLRQGLASSFAVLGRASSLAAATEASGRALAAAPKVRVGPVGGQAAAAAAAAAGGPTTPPLPLLVLCFNWDTAS